MAHPGCLHSVRLGASRAALPLGSHLRIDAWDDQVRFLSTKPEAILNASEKMPLKLTPIYFRLSALFFFRHVDRANQWLVGTGVRQQFEWGEFFPTRQRAHGITAFRNPAPPGLDWSHKSPSSRGATYETRHRSGSQAVGAGRRTISARRTAARSILERPTKRQQCGETKWAVTKCLHPFRALGSEERRSRIEHNQHFAKINSERLRQIEFETTADNINKFGGYPVGMLDPPTLLYQ